MKKTISLLLSLVLFISLCSCNTPTYSDSSLSHFESYTVSCFTNADNVSSAAQNSSSRQQPSNNTPSSQPVQKAVDYSALPSYSGKPYITLNNNNPSFSQAELNKTAYEQYGELDSLGRCTAAIAICGKEIMPKENEKRGSISSIKPTGWVQAQYDNVSGKSLYNRCHLIGWQLSAENANKKNLITGTRYMNTKGMLPFENMVADYINETGHHVAYRITPIFLGNNLVASGVQMEAFSIEDNGEGICFNVYVYNVQPDITIDYATGKSTGPKTAISSEKASSKEVTATSSTASVMPLPLAKPNPHKTIRKLWYGYQTAAKNTI